MSDLRCELQKLTHTDEPALTVGEKFVLQCKGQVAVFDWKTAELRLDAADKYKLLLVKGEGAESELRLEVLSDRVGQHDLKNVQLVDANQSAVIPEVKFEVRSVQDPQNPVTEPYGAMGPVKFSIPWFYWVILIVVISVIGLTIAVSISLKLRRRRMMKEILDAAPPVSPEAELFQAVRKYQREWTFLMQPREKVDAAVAGKSIEDLDHTYRVFLSRSLEMPIARWSTGKSLTALNRERKDMPLESRRQVGKILREFKRSKQSELNGQDFAQFLEWVKGSVSDITLHLKDLE